MAVNLQGAGRALRCAYGPAASIYDNALFDRDTDSAVVFETAGKLRLAYNWDADCYDFCFDTMGWDFARAFRVHVERDVYARSFDIDYKRVNPHSTFKTPPVGWMTWYAVQFDAGEKTVLENVQWRKNTCSAMARIPYGWIGNGTTGIFPPPARTAWICIIPTRLPIPTA